MLPLYSNLTPLNRNRQPNERLAISKLKHINGMKEPLGRFTWRRTNVKRRKRENFFGKKFGRLTVLEEAPDKFYGREQYGWAAWKCECDCGEIVIVCGTTLKRGLVKSCGCKRLEATTKHGHTSGGIKSQEFVAWIGMKQRCLNPKSDYYHRYGGRGIKVCARWLHSFDNFLKDMGRKPSGKHSVERKNRNGNYCPSNCKWGTVEEQQNNKINNRVLSFYNKTLTLSQWAREYNISPSSISYRLKKGWTVNKSITTPPDPNKQRCKIERNCIT